MLLLPIIYGKLQQLEELPDNWKCANTMPAFKEEEEEKETSGNYKLVGLTSVTGKMVEHLVLESISNHVKPQRSSGTVSTDLARAIHTQPAWLPSVMKWMSVGINGEQWM